MTTILGPLAIHQILSFTEQDFRRRLKKLRNAVRVPQVGLMARHVSWKWRHIWELYFAGEPRQSLDYLRSPELLLYLKAVLDCGDMRVVFGHGKPIQFHKDIPLRLVSKVVEAFERLREESSSLYIFITIPYELPIRRCGRSAMSAPPEPVVRDLADIWPEVYSDHLPCAKCTSTEREFDESRVMLRPGKCSRPRKWYVTETFHVPSKHFQTKLTVELHFSTKREDADLQSRPSMSSMIKKTELCQVLVYLDDGTCGRGPVRQAQSGTACKSQSKIFLPDFASEVYGFLDRLHLGTSLTANRSLSALLSKLKTRLPLHHLKCKFEAKGTRASMGNGAYWPILKHFRCDLSYIDVRRLAIPSTEGAAADCALILRYLSNSHVTDLKAPDRDDRFSLKMLAALLVDHNCTLGRLRMGALDGELTDYRSLDVVFGGGVRLNSLHLSISRQGLVNLIKRADFLRMPTIQGLSELMLVVKEPTSVGRHGTSRYTVSPNKPSPQHRDGVVSAPLWIAGIHLLPTSTRYEVKCGRQRRSQSIARELVRICEKFELGVIMQVVHRFKCTGSLRGVLPFNARNRIASSTSTVYFGFFQDLCAWEVYRFRNAVSGEWLTACVGHRETGRWIEFVLHVLKGEADPDAMYALGW